MSNIGNISTGDMFQRYQDSRQSRRAIINKARGKLNNTIRDLSMSRNDPYQHNNYSNQRRGQQPYQRRGQQPYQRRGQQPYQSRGQQPYQRRGQQPYQSNNREVQECINRCRNR